MTTTLPLFFLVDYDNLRRFSRGKSLSVIANHLINKIPDSYAASASSAEVRLYGGWRAGSTTTVLAQQLASESARTFPIMVNRLINEKHNGIKVNLRLAYSPIFLPRISIDDTYIKGRSARRIYLEQRPWISCPTATTCSLNSLEHFLNNDLCSDNKCTISPKDVFRQDEQKQVDTMMVADLAYISHKKISTKVVIVSSDADIWPGILLSLNENIEVLQIQTNPGAKPPRTAMSTLGHLARNYTSISI